MIELAWWGRVPYAAALERQRAARQAIIEGEGREYIALLEHPSVVTVGRRPAPGTPSASDLRAHGIDFARIERGGLATWHGPGQLVGYVLVDVGGRGGGVRRTVDAVEEGIIDWLATRGVAAGRRAGFPGVWVGTGKICAIGLHFKRGVSLHGFALNLTCDLDGFGRIVPCGITEGGVTALNLHSPQAPTPMEASWSVGRAVRARLVDTFRRQR